MTVLAWDGTTLAADKRAVSFGLILTTTKVFRHGGAIFGITGDGALALEMRAWYVAGADPEKFPPAAREDKATLIVADARGVHEYVTGPYPRLVEDKFGAWGSGRDFALAAMAMGRNARDAVELACRFSADCGNGCDALRL